MYIIIDKKTKEILHMSNSIPGEEKEPQELLSNFDPKTMEFGRAPEQFIAEKFTIKNGVVKNIEEETPEPPKETLEEARLRKLNSFSRLSLEMRQEILPDYKLQNVALGLYPEAKIVVIRDTVQAFRDEFHRLEAAVGRARSVKAVDAIEAKFPQQLEVKKASPTRKARTTRKTTKSRAKSTRKS